MSVTAIKSRAVAAPAKATYQDVLDAPPNMVAEIMVGQLHRMARPLPGHAMACTGLIAGTGVPFHFDDGPDGWMILPEPEPHLSEDVVVPDIAGWRAHWDEIDLNQHITVAPDWVREILSPSTRRMDLGPNRAIYADHGFGHLWFVDPSARMLDSYALRAGDWVSAGSALDQDLVCLPPFEAISFPTSALWR